MKVLFLILLLSVSAQAQKIEEGKSITNWIPVGVGSVSRNDSSVKVEGTGAAEMSFANVQRSEHTFKGWVRFIFPSTALVSEGKWQELRFYVVCDCRKNSLRALSGIAYGLDGSVRAEKAKIDLPTEQGTIGRQMFEFFCERGGPPAVAPTLKP